MLGSNNDSIMAPNLIRGCLVDPFNVPVFVRHGAFARDHGPRLKPIDKGFDQRRWHHGIALVIKRDVFPDVSRTHAWMKSPTCPSPAALHSRPATDAPTASTGHVPSAPAFAPRPRPIIADTRLSLPARSTSARVSLSLPISRYSRLGHASTPVQRSMSRSVSDLHGSR